MGKEDAKMKLSLKDGGELFFERVKLSGTHVWVMLIEQDKPADLARIFPWGNIRDLEIPAALEPKTVIMAQLGPGPLG